MLASQKLNGYGECTMQNIDLTQFTPEELRELQTRCAYALSDNVVEHKFSEPERMLWLEICAVMRANRGSLESFVRTFGVQRFKDCALDMETVLDKALPEDVKRNVRNTVRSKIMNCLADYLRDASLAVSPKTLLNNFDKLEYATDRHYPGYIAAQLLHRIVLAVA